MTTNTFRFFIKANNDHQAGSAFGQLVHLLGKNFPDFAWIINSVSCKEYSIGLREVNFSFVTLFTPLKEITDFMSTGKWFKIKNKTNPDYLWDANRSEGDIEAVFIVPEVVWANVEEKSRVEL